MIRHNGIRMAVTTGGELHNLADRGGPDDWRLRGRCSLDADPELFYSPDGERPGARTRRETEAVTYCRACPVRPECRRDALDRREQHGVWGGMTEDDRADYWHRQRCANDRARRAGGAA